MRDEAETRREAEAAVAKSKPEQPNSPMGAVCFPALILARVAIDRGMKVEDDVYLPVRLLPNWTLKTAGV